MRLAVNETIILGGESVILTRLRPTLRAAYTLHSRFGFDRLYAGIVDGNAAAMADVIVACSVEPVTFSKTIARIARQPLAESLEPLIAPLSRIVLMLAGIDPDEQPKPVKSTGKAMSWGDYHEHLFRIGTGWLGWTPETTWNATPAEIEAAYKGRIEMLCAMAGVEPPQDEREPNAEEVSEGLAKLKMLAIRGDNRGR